MLARLESVSCSFDGWHALLTTPNREIKSADYLERRGVRSYLPLFTRSVRWRRSIHRPKSFAVIPGMLFIPKEMMDVIDRDRIFYGAHVYGYLRSSLGYPSVLTTKDIDLIRGIEVRLNTQVTKNGCAFTVGQKVKLKDEMYSAYLGQGEVVEVLAHGKKIGILVPQLFSRPTKLYVPATDLVAM